MCYQVGFGPAQPTSVLWLGNIPESVTDRYVQKQVALHSPVLYTRLNTTLQQGLIYFKSSRDAIKALEGMRNRAILGISLFSYLFYSDKCFISFSNI